MSSKHLICFDASISNGVVGIGIWDFTNKKKTYKSFTEPTENCSSYIAESMALIASLQYINENDIESAFLFTDNMNLYDKGISKTLLEKYTKNINSVNLFWIPREFNKDADLLSKFARTIEATKLQSINEFNTPIDSLKSTKDWNLKIELRKYTLSRRLALGRRLAITEEQMNFINNKPCSFHNIIDKDRAFFRFCSMLFSKQEHTNTNLYLSSLSNVPKFSSSKMEKLIRSRNLI